MKLIGAIVLAATATLVAAAEPPTIGIVAMGPQPVFRELPTYARFYARMRELGWREGENIRYVGRGAAGNIGNLDPAVQELLKSAVTVIVTVGWQEALAAKRATSIVPIVMVHPNDPVELGLVTSLNRPGGNITGSYTPSLHAKREELLSEILPGAKRLLLAYDPPTPSGKIVAAMAEAAQRYRHTATWIELPANGEYDAWAAKARRDGADSALIPVAASTFRPARRKAIAEALIKHRLPAMCSSADYVESGCLASYSAAGLEFFASAAEYVDKILRGAKPGDLAIRQPSVFEFVVNLKTAKALGISIPQSVLVRADRVVE